MIAKDWCGLMLPYCYIGIVDLKPCLGKEENAFDHEVFRLHSQYITLSGCIRNPAKNMKAEVENNLFH